MVVWGLSRPIEVPGFAGIVRQWACAFGGRESGQEQSPMERRDSVLTGEGDIGLWYDRGCTPILASQVRSTNQIGTGAGQTPAHSA